MKHYIMKKSVSIITFLFVLCSMSAQKVQPKLNLVKGETYYQNMNVDAEIEQSFSGQDMKMNMGMNMKMSCKVTAVENAVFTLEMRYHKMTFAMDTPGGNMSFDSDKKDSGDSFSAVMGAMTDKPFYMKITADGKVTEIKGIDAIFSAAIKQFDTLDEGTKQQIMGQLEQSYGEESIRKNMEVPFAVYPGKQVSKGDKWTIKTKMESGSNADIETVYELIDVTPEYYVLKGNAKITQAEASKNSDTPQMDNISGTMTSDLKLNKKTGWISSAAINQEIKGVVNVQGSELPVAMKNKLTVSDSK